MGAMTEVAATVLQGRIGCLGREPDGRDHGPVTSEGSNRCVVLHQAGVDPTLEGRSLQDVLRRAVAARCCPCSLDVDHAGWVVTLHSPDEQDFYGRTLEVLAWCLVWLMFPELGIGPLLVWTSFLSPNNGQRPLFSRVSIVTSRPAPTLQPISRRRRS